MLVSLLGSCKWQAAVFHRSPGSCCSTVSHSTTQPNHALSKGSHSISDTPFRQSINRVPRATYRFQLRSGFGFDEIREQITYIDRLGASELYLSPFFQSREESVHGYDVVDHSRIESTFGDEADFRDLAMRARQYDLGILLDLVPNHMGINDPKNLLWNDVLENGQAARSASCFDIDWNPYGGGVSNQVLLPFLGKPFGETLENGELSVEYKDSRFVLCYYDRRFPIAPTTWPKILSRAVDLIRENCDVDDLMELQSIVTQLQRLSPVGQQTELATDDRYREQEVARRRLSVLLEHSHPVFDAIECALKSINGGDSGSQRWSLLEALLNYQHYRLAFWRVAADEINYRRFFDINDLAAIRVENEDVFNIVHALTFRLLAEGLVTGVRIDHPDGLLDPKDYFSRLQSVFARSKCSGTSHEGIGNPDSASLYVVAEKILSGEEHLRKDWLVNGTTGYDFLNDVSGLLVCSQGVRRLQERYESMTEVDQQPRDIVYHGKLTILHDSMASELAMIASQLFQLAKASRATRDFTLPALHRALREIIACFPVYRTYVPSFGWDVTDEDHRRVMEAVRWAKRRNRTMAWSMLDYIAAVLLLEFPANLAEELKPQWRKFATRFQQVTGPVTAKGVEDTAFYRYFPLASLNEVGGELGSTGISVEQFHVKMHLRNTDWPSSLSATATHDTKRGEDVRARLHVLSEVADAWADNVLQLHDITQPFVQELDGELVPTKNERYFIYQTLLGTWPVSTVQAKNLGEDAWNKYRERIFAYCKKALREAKQHTSWLNPSASYENAVECFLAELMASPENEPMRTMGSLANGIAGPGFVNSISQVILKSMLPGVPDFYQGCEFWDFRLVDPDNRQPVDFALRMTTLSHLQSSYAADSLSLLTRLHDDWSDDLKMLLTWRALETRRSFAALFERGNYSPIHFQGSRSAHLFGFCRQLGEQWVCVIVPRLPWMLVDDSAIRRGEMAMPRDFCDRIWESNHANLPMGAPTHWIEQVSGAEYVSTKGCLDISQLFSNQFVVLLTGSNHEEITS